MIASSGFLTDLECTKFIFGRGSVSDPTRGAYSAPPDHLAGLRGPTSNFQGERERRETGKGKKKGRKRGTGGTPFRKFLDLPLLL